MMNEKKDLKNPNVILASQSPRRHELIKKLLNNFEVIVPDFDEKLENDNYSDEKIKELSLNKAKSVFDKILRENIPDKQNKLIISADTVVVLDNKILGKPKNEQHAINMLQALSGRQHFVVTAVTAFDTNTQKSYCAAVKTFVTFCDLKNELIMNYVKNKKPLDKAGAYGIQELDNDFIYDVDGDLDNVIGLPTKALKNMLIEAGFVFD